MLHCEYQHRVGTGAVRVDPGGRRAPGVGALPHQREHLLRARHVDLRGVLREHAASAICGIFPQAQPAARLAAGAHRAAQEVEHAFAVHLEELAADLGLNSIGY